MPEVIYEVTLRVDADIAEAYDVWLREHAAEMLALPGFLSAEISESDGGSELPPGTVERVVHYRLRDRAALDAYFRDHARRMRDAGLARFGERVRADRRILAPSMHSAAG